MLLNIVPTLILPNISKASSTGSSVVRIAGNDKFDTSVKASQKTYYSSEYAVIASGDDFADALAGGTLATQLKAPLLLASKDSITEGTLEEIARLGVSTVYVIGGEAAISKEVATEIEETTGAFAERIFGADRYGTAMAISRKRNEFSGKTSEPAAMNGTNFPDALAAAPFVGKMDNVHLVPYKDGLLPKYVFGGTAAVPKTTSEKVRFQGADRYGTAAAVARGYKTYLNKDIDTVIIATGTGFPDALSASTIAGMTNSVLLLTKANELPIQTKTYIESNPNIKNVIILGGTFVVSTNVENELKQLVKYSSSEVQDVEAVKKEVFNLVNQKREEKGLKLLEWRDDMSQGAQIRAGEVSVNFSEGDRELEELFLGIDTECIYEEIALGEMEPSRIVEQWKETDYGNIYDPTLKYINIGYKYERNSVNKHHWVAVLGVKEEVIDDGETIILENGKEISSNEYEEILSETSDEDIIFHEEVQIETVEAVKDFVENTDSETLLEVVKNVQSAEEILSDEIDNYEDKEPLIKTFSSQEIELTNNLKIEDIKQFKDFVSVNNSQYILEVLNDDTETIESKLATLSSQYIKLSQYLKELFSVLVTASVYISGVGTVVLIVAATTYIVYKNRKKIVKVGSRIWNSTVNFFSNKARARRNTIRYNAEVDRAIGRLGGYSKGGKAGKIMHKKHKWHSFYGGNNDPSRWEKIKKMMKKVMKEGREFPHKGVRKRLLRIKGRTVEVTFRKYPNGRIDIGNGWVR
ncbi:cell wall-binding repeat-containing protein [Miniphocaeibacter massiliensis]|uniref:cell wall-binding repeat-containing protein n=1 Tax=Miniphocaeibacter massiliensis TaxID=2041841 RepID=UPI0013EA1576|nr:cell wall-binding repeat-containing protein [Miniphocaeibacter massiliensis]